MFLPKFKIKCTFLQYYSLFSWKSSLKREGQQHVAVSTQLLAIYKLTCKTIYNNLIDRQQYPPLTEEGRLTKCGFSTQGRQTVYYLPFRVTKEVKLSVFQNKIVHKILYTNKILFKMKKTPSPYCPYCTNVEHMISHLFFTCLITESFWSEFTTLYNSLCKKKEANS